MLKGRYLNDVTVGALPDMVTFTPDGTRVLRVRGSIDRVDTAAESLLTLDYKRTHKKRGPGRPAAA